MTDSLRSSGSCCVCASRDARSLVDVQLVSGVRATLCGSHAVMHARSGAKSLTVAELRERLHDRRARRDRREVGDELGTALAVAFRDERRGERERRRA